MPSSKWATLVHLVLELGQQATAQFLRKIEGIATWTEPIAAAQQKRLRAAIKGTMGTSGVGRACRLDTRGVRFREENAQRDIECDDEVRAAGSFSYCTVRCEGSPHTVVLHISQVSLTFNGCREREVEEESERCSW